MNRRRMIRILAGMALTPVAAWTGAAPSPARAAQQRIALGAEARLDLRGPAAVTGPAERAAWEELDRIEQIFSLYRTESELSRLNRDGRFATPAPELVALLRLAGQIHDATGGRFDPTVQPLWRALAEGRPTGAAERAIGWDRVRLSEHEITLGPGQALTLNGIAQGYATDRVAQVLAQHGLEHALIEIGEFQALGGPFQVGIADPLAGRLGQISLRDGAVATSSPQAMQLMGGTGHILAPGAHGVKWRTVSVSAPSAAVADGLSTALCLAGPAPARAILRKFPGTRARVVSHAGDFLTL